MAAANSGYRATAPDLLGFGRSPSPPEASYDVDCHLGALMPELPRRALSWPTSPTPSSPPDPEHSALNLRVVDGDHQLAVRRPGVVGDALVAALDGASGT